MTHEHAWAVVLAGGDGTRMRSFTRLLSGEERPKQFCNLYGGRTLLAQTRSRLAAVFPPDQMMYVLVKSHERFYKPELSDVHPSRLVVQPSNRGTIPAVVYSLLRLNSLAGDPIVGFFPTDHHYSSDGAFAMAIERALAAIRANPETVILVGASARHPEVEYGWIEPSGEPEQPHSLLRVKRFWEKPSAQLAQLLHRAGCFWNTFVMIGRASGFMYLIREAMPGALEDGDIPSGDFSRQVLANATSRLVVLPLGDVRWSDLGTPQRLKSVLRAASASGSPLHRVQAAG